MSLPPQRCFERVNRSDSDDFIAIRAHQFDELDCNDGVINSVVLESIEIQPLSTSTISCGVISQVGGELVLGVDMDNRPAAQAFLGNSLLPVNPAWRLPKSITGEAKARRSFEFVLRELHDEYGVVCTDMFSLGGRYHPAPGLTSEVVHPFAVVVDQVVVGQQQLYWVPLRQLLNSANEIVDGHLRLMVYRIAHAFQLLDKIEES